ncbi:MAG: DUF421 domain-containing protein [Oscillospiraceae bacterium]|nr:DUF421 domain-containing protein [Oscillospiraceae bacterium]
MYILIIFTIRVMGKKSLGEFQPSDLVSTILISNLTSVIIEEPHLPLAFSIAAILIIMSLEVYMSVLARKNSKFAEITQGKAKILIQNGVINQNTMKELRFSVEDVVEALHSKDVFYLEEVNLAILETTGSVSVYKDPNANSNITKAVLPPLPVIVDQRVNYQNLDAVNQNYGKLDGILERNRTSLDKVLLMTLDGDGRYNITYKEDI